MSCLKLALATGPTLLGLDKPNDLTTRMSWDMKFSSLDDGWQEPLHLRRPSAALRLGSTTGVAIIIKVG